MAALPRHIQKLGHSVRVFLPLYDTIDISKASFSMLPGMESIPIQLGPHRYDAGIVTATLPGTDLQVHLVHCAPLYARGSIYTSDQDEHRRFLALIWAAFMACQRMGFSPDVIHCNDWQAALL